MRGTGVQGVRMKKKSDLHSLWPWRVIEGSLRLGKAIPALYYMTRGDVSAFNEAR